ncbi:MAG: hypothetical protein NT105_13395 [Verrucomicrobia bacterium]|nr:hypothetical protein [Verrucomicrobiota bacterium]
MSDGSSYGPFTVAVGPAGPEGAAGSEGPQGPAGEVNGQQLSDAIAGSSANSNAVQELPGDADHKPPSSRRSMS